MVDKNAYQEILKTIQPYHATLIAVSKTKPVRDIEDFVDLGQMDFGENYVQELVEKQQHFQKPYWHFIGHLQTNKVKYIAPFVYLIQSVDSLKLLQEINHQASKQKRTISCLLQIHIAQEESKFGFTPQSLEKDIINITPTLFPNIRIEGLMGMATLTHNMQQVRQEYKTLKTLFDQLKSYQNNIISMRTLSMGMSGDYEIALDEGSTMVRIGSLLFGKR